MMFKRVLNELEDNYIFPFLWMMGESHEMIGREMEGIRSCGIRSVCLESRPHPDFAGEKWWDDMDFVLEKARELDMKIWILDDDHFPTGHAVGRFEGKDAALRKTYLAEKHADFFGDREQAFLYRALIGKDAKILAVFAVRRPDPDSAVLDLSSVYDLTEGIQGEFCFFHIPEKGLFRVFTLYTTQENGGRENYMNLVDSRSVQVLIDAVYEPHYRRYADEFGKTILGFFSDEPELGNVPGYAYDNRLGMEDIKLPWSPELEEAIRKRFGARWKEKLLGCWFEIGEETEKIRIGYMDEMTRLVYRCFSGQLGKWCRDHGVEYIGHVIEDSGASLNMGCSIGHYFREMKGQAMAGIDVVHHQIDPGHTGAVHQWLTDGRGGDFFHYQLAKLGSSSAHIDAEKKGRSLCEVFGSYGWALDTPDMKWLLDHMMVRGINHFVPHAFSITDPNQDCPPHFFAQGKNPQFGYFRTLMRYANRVCDLISGGEPVLGAAVLYPAETYWSGRAVESLNEICKALMTDQIDFDIVPEDFLVEAGGGDKDTMFGRTGREYPALVIPGGKRISRETILFLQKHPEVPVFICGAVPEQDTEGMIFNAELYKNLHSVTLKEMPSAVKSLRKYTVTVKTEAENLRVMRYRKPEGELFYFFNEDVYDRASFCVHGSFGSVQIYDAVSNSVRRVRTAGDCFEMALEPGETLLCTFRKEAEGETIIKQEQQELKLPAVVSLQKGDHYEVWKTISPGEELPGMNRIFPEYCGVFHYEMNFSFRKNQGRRVAVYLPCCGNGAEIKLNGKAVGTIFQDYQRIEITEALQDGDNILEIFMANTLVWQRPDPASAFAAIRPTGLTAYPVLETEMVS